MPDSVFESHPRLNDIEPREGSYAGLGPADVPALEAALGDKEAWRAARAVNALARIDAPEARAALTRASASPRPEVRVAVASVIPRLPVRPSNTVLTRLLADPDPGVRKFAIRSVSVRNNATVIARLRELATVEKDPILRELAAEQANALTTTP